MRIDVNACYLAWSTMRMVGYVLNL